MLRYRDGYLEALARGKRTTITELAAAANIARERVSRWERKPDFVTWFDDSVATATRRLVNPMHLAQMHQAFTSLPHYQTQLRRLGLETPWGAPEQQGGSSTAVAGVVVNLHGLPSIAPDRSTLPPPIMRHPVTGEIIPIPPAAPLPLEAGPQTPAAPGA